MPSSLKRPKNPPKRAKAPSGRKASVGATAATARKASVARKAAAGRKASVRGKTGTGPGPSIPGKAGSSLPPEAPAHGAPPAAPAPNAGLARVRNLVALDAGNLMRRLDAHAEEMIGLFSRLRDREPLLNPLRSALSTMSFSDLSLLEPRQQSAVGFFVEELEALRWYFRYTVDMPSAAEQRLRQHRRRLRLAYERLLESVGPAQPPELPPELPGP